MSDDTFYENARRNKSLRQAYLDSRELPCKVPMLASVTYVPQLFKDGEISTGRKALVWMKTDVEAKPEFSVNDMLEGNSPAIEVRSHLYVGARAFSEEISGFDGSLAHEMSHAGPDGLGFAHVALGIEALKNHVRYQWRRRKMSEDDAMSSMLLLSFWDDLTTADSEIIAYRREWEYGVRNGFHQRALDGISKRKHFYVEQALPLRRALPSSLKSTAPSIEDAVRSGVEILRQGLGGSRDCLGV